LHRYTEANATRVEAEATTAEMARKTAQAEARLFAAGVAGVAGGGGEGGGGGGGEERNNSDNNNNNNVLDALDADWNDVRSISSGGGVSISRAGGGAVHVDSP
jgi:hypothetical protein